jgi:hypothetical protein
MSSTPFGNYSGMFNPEEAFWASLPLLVTVSPRQRLPHLPRADSRLQITVECQKLQALAHTFLILD